MIKGIILSLISACAYGALAVFVKMGYAMGLTTVQMLTYRFAFGAAALAVFYLFFRPKALLFTPRLLLKCAGLGLGLYMMQSMFFFTAIKYIPASTAALLLYLYPLVVIILSTYLLKVKFRMASLISALLILAGCCLVFYDAFLRQLNVTGILLGLGAPLTFGFYLTLSQVVLRNERSANVALYMLVWTGLAYAVINGGFGIQGASPQQLMLGVALGVVSSAIAIGLLYAALDLIGATYVSLFSSIEPAVTLVLAGIFLGEHIVIYQIYGVILLILGIVVPNIGLIKQKA